MSACLMPHLRPSIHDLTGIAETAARAADEDAALDTVITDVSRALDTRACIFQRVERGWMLMAQARGGLRLSISDLQVALDAVPVDALIDAVDLRPVGEGIWTSMSLKDPNGPLMLLLVSGDWSILDRTLMPFVTSLTLAFTCVREREAKRRAERMLIDGYTMARRLSRLGGVETVC